MKNRYKEYYLMGIREAPFKPEYIISEIFITYCDTCKCDVYQVCDICRFDYRITHTVVEILKELCISLEVRFFPGIRCHDVVDIDMINVTLDQSSKLSLQHTLTAVCNVGVI